MIHRPTILAAALLVVGLIVGAELGFGFLRGPSVQIVTSTRVVTTTQVATSTQFVANGQTWDYLAFHSPSLSSPPDSAAPGITFAVVSADSSWGSVGKTYPELFLSPGQSKAYPVRLFIDPQTLPMTGRLLPIDGLGLSVHFGSSSVNGSTGGANFTMTVSLAANFSAGLNAFLIPVVFSSVDRVQPVSFGPIFLISGFPGQNVNGTSSSGQPAFSFEDNLRRGYAMDLTFHMTNTSVLSQFGPFPSGSVCAGLDQSGALFVSSNGGGYPCDSLLGPPTLSLALRPGQTTRFVIALKLITQVGVQLGFSSGLGYTQFSKSILHD